MTLVCVLYDVSVYMIWH